MPEGSTYSLADFLMFAPRTYYRLFELYNAAIWPAQLGAQGLGLAILALLRWGGPWRGRAVAAILAAAWAWTAWAFHWRHFTACSRLPWRHRTVSRPDFSASPSRKRRISIPSMCRSSGTFAPAAGKRVAHIAT